MKQAGRERFSRSDTVTDELLERSAPPPRVHRRPPSDAPERADVRVRLMDAAGEEFAERGYHRATIRDICKRAGANIAAVNYHFGDKQQLYEAILHHTYQAAYKKYPPEMGVTADSPPERRLFAFIHSFLLRTFDPERPAWHGRLFARELLEPTAALDSMVARDIRPRAEQLERILAELLDDAATPELLRHSIASVVGQIIYYQNAGGVFVRLFPEHSLDAAHLERLARHITDFSLHALAGFARATASK